jgi:hypothetical protein
LQGRGSGLGPNSMTLWIRMRNPDPGSGSRGQQNEEKGPQPWFLFLCTWSVPVVVPVLDVLGDPPNTEIMRVTAINTFSKRMPVWNFARWKQFLEMNSGTPFGEVSHPAYTNFGLPVDSNPAKHTNFLRQTHLKQRTIHLVYLKARMVTSCGSNPRIRMQRIRNIGTGTRLVSKNKNKF